MEQKTCGECKNYFKVYFEDAAPSYHSQLERKCLASSELDLNTISNIMMLRNDEDPSMKSCTHFDPKAGEKTENQGKKKGKK